MATNMEKLRVVSMKAGRAGSVCVAIAATCLSALCQQPGAAQAKTNGGAKAKPVVAGKPYGVRKPGLPPSAQRYYESTWGVEVVGVKAVESGALLRFSYRVLDPERAKPLNDKKSKPFLYDISSHVRLEVPQMEKVGQLRQSAAPEEGHVYWMVFANQQRLVRPGARVDVSIGDFRAQGLLVE